MPRDRHSTTAEVLLPGRFRYLQVWIHARIWIEDETDLCVKPTFPSRLFVRHGYRLTPADVTEAGRALGFVHLWLVGKKRPMSIWAHDPKVISHWVERQQSAQAIRGHS